MLFRWATPFVTCCRLKFGRIVSLLHEARAGDPQVAAKRNDLAAGLPLLTVADEVVALAEALVRRGPLPPNAAADAVHSSLWLGCGTPHVRRSDGDVFALVPGLASHGGET